ncbi:cytochrome c/c1 heme-lyase [Rhizoctonia solani]|nr:cytochrome c/c1 heme-lyase [Rhizoctonia solani]
MGQTTSAPAAPSAPVNPHTGTTGTPPPSCPMHSAAAPPVAQCPIPHDPDAINPHNNMPILNQNRAPGQVLDLPVDRTVSSIPRAAGSTYGPAGPTSGADTNAGRWEYPSPQQFYNALVRKGWETPEEHVETMVHIHNFLNEEAWLEVLKWEAKRDGGPEEAADLQLVKFQGKPGQLSPKARLFQFAGWLLPSRFDAQPPFDRHDWIVRRPKTQEEVRYVIDYYGGEPDENGQPVFNLDVRPALDNFDSIKTRIGVATSEAWSTFRQGNTGAPQS